MRQNAARDGSDDDDGGDGGGGDDDDQEEEEEDEEEDEDDDGSGGGGDGDSWELLDGDEHVSDDLGLAAGDNIVDVDAVTQQLKDLVIDARLGANPDEDVESALSMAHDVVVSPDAGVVLAHWHNLEEQPDMQAETVLSLLFDTTAAVDDEAVAASVNAAASSDDEDDADGADDDAWLNTFATACAGAASQEAVVRRNLGTLDKLGWGTIKTMVVATFAPCKQLVQNLPDGVVDDDVKQAVDKLDGLLLRVARGVEKRKQSSLLGHFQKAARPTEELVGGGGY